MFINVQLYSSLSEKDYPDFFEKSGQNEPGNFRTAERNPIRNEKN